MIALGGSDVEQELESAGFERPHLNAAPVEAAWTFTTGC